MAVTAAVDELVPAPAELGVLPTPLHEAPRLAEALGISGRLLLKRDDLAGFAVGGNKTRPLRLLIGQAQQSGADVFLTGGSPGSNFCQAAVAAAAWAGLDCVLVYAGEPGPRIHPNHAAAAAWGAELRWTGDPDRASVDLALQQVAAELSGAGRTPFVAPRGGATALGAVGFHQAARELSAQLADPATVVLATGSGGTTAGLVAGAVALGRSLQVRGASVSRPLDEIRRRVVELARGCARLVGTEPPASDDVVIEDARGPGHGAPSEEGQRAARLALRTAGVVLDPVYSAKALAALPGILGDERRDPDRTTVFWHTGGLLDAVAGWEGR